MHEDFESLVSQDAINYRKQVERKSKRRESYLFWLLVVLTVLGIIVVVVL